MGIVTVGTPEPRYRIWTIVRVLWVRAAVGRRPPLAWAPMDYSRIAERGLTGARALYRRIPVQHRSRLQPLVERGLGGKVSLRRVEITQSTPTGWRPALAPVVIEAPDDLFIPKALVKRGLAGYEPFALETFLAVLDLAGPGAVLDIGANVGLYALLAAAHGGRAVHAFEPTPRVAAAARRSARVSGLPIRVHRSAVGDRVGPVTLYVSNTSDASNSLNPQFRQSVQQLVVPGTTVDAFCARRRVRPAILKIDTESTEAAVLRGARRVIERHRPWILLEVLPARARGELDALMAGSGYTYYHLTRAGVIEPATQILGALGGADMYLLSPRAMRAPDWRVVAGWREALTRVRMVHSHVEISDRILDPTLLPLPA